MKYHTPKRPFKEKLASFLCGRNGPDALYNFVTYICLALILLNLLLRSPVVVGMYFALFFYSIFRFMSKKVYKRQQENAAFLKIRKKLFAPFSLLRAKIRDRKTHVYRKCPSCKNNLRLPKRPGYHTVVCPCCRHRFDINIK